MSTRISLTYCGMEGSGATVKEAKQDAARKIESALKGSYTPTLLVGFGGDARLVFRTTEGWCHSRIEDRADGSMLWGSGCAKDLPTAVREARMSLAQNAIFRAADHGLSILHDKDDKAEHARYVAWQMAAKEGASLGQDPHSYGCEHQARFYGWEKALPVAV